MQYVRFVQQDRHGVNFLAGGTSGVPDTDERPRSKYREHFLAECPVKADVTKHRGYIDCHFLHKPAQILFIVVDAITKFSKTDKPVVDHQSVEPPLQRSTGIAGEVIPVQLHYIAYDNLQLIIR